MKRYIRKLLSEVLGAMYENGQIRDIPSFAIDIPKPSFGDFSINVAHAIAREGRFQVNDVADIIARSIKELDKGKTFANITVLNGFINLTISSEKLGGHLLELQKKIKFEQ